MDQRSDWHLTDEVLHEMGEGDPFAAAVRATRMAMLITDPKKADNPIIFCNEAFQKLTGYSREEVIGRNCRFLQGSETSPDDVAKIRKAVQDESDIQIDILNYCKDGSKFWNALYLSAVRSTAGKVQFFFASLIDVTERIEAKDRLAAQKEDVEREIEARTAELKAALEAKTILLHEVDHRVKNNLNMVGSMLRLQSRSISDPSIIAKLDTMLERIDALASVHRRLYQSADVTNFDVGTFAANLVNEVIGSSGRTDIRVKADFENIQVPSKNAAAFGLILNEIVTNAVKHAYKDGRPGEMSVSAKINDGEAIIAVTDDGLGMIQNVSTDGLGHTLISRLSKQVGAQIEWIDTKPGTRVALKFPVGEHL